MPGRDLSGDEGTLDGEIGELSAPPPLLGRNSVSQRRLDKRRAVSVWPDGLGNLGGGGMVAAADDEEPPEFDPLFDSHDDFVGGSGSGLASGKNPWMCRRIHPGFQIGELLEDYANNIDFDPLFDSYDDFGGGLGGGLAGRTDPWMGRGITPLPAN
ncbi:hypothetical protein CF319_g9117 [Tilletia indica]|nr:hypothetical protein CF319_g9117 [Tilletia indica]